MGLLFILGVWFMIYGFARFVFCHNRWEPHKGNVLLMENVFISVGLLNGYSVFKDGKFILGILWTATTILFFIVVTRKNKKIDNYETLIIGDYGSEKAHHPWDCLVPCVCGAKYPWMMIDEDTAWVPKGYEEELFIMCPHCGRRTEKIMSNIAIDYWNIRKLQEGEEDSLNDQNDRYNVC